MKEVWRVRGGRGGREGARVGKKMFREWLKINIFFGKKWRVTFEIHLRALGSFSFSNRSFFPCLNSGTSAMRAKLVCSVGKIISRRNKLARWKILVRVSNFPACSAFILIRRGIAWFVIWRRFPTDFSFPFFHFLKRFLPFPLPLSFFSRMSLSFRSLSIFFSPLNYHWKQFVLDQVPLSPA